MNSEQNNNSEEGVSNHTNNSNSFLNIFHKYKFRFIFLIITLIGLSLLIFLLNDSETKEDLIVESNIVVSEEKKR